MTALAALAAAVRDRLMAGAPAPLPGVGTLVRAHVSARVQVGPDGSRVLLPPGEAIGLAGGGGDPDALAALLAKHTGTPPEEAATALREAVDQVEARLAVTGEVKLPGVGTLQRTSGGIRFAADPELLAAVNRPFQGLSPVAASAPPPGAPSAGASPPRTPSAPESFAPPVAAPPAVSEPSAAPPLPVVPPAPAGDSPAIDTLLDLIVNEPSESEQAGRAEAERAATPSASGDFAPDDADGSTSDTLSSESHDEVAQANGASDEMPSAPSAATEETAGDAPSAPRPPSPTESAFVDEDTLDEDLDTVLAVPFGLPDGEGLRDVLPPTPADHDPTLADEAPSTEPESAPDDAEPSAAAAEPPATHASERPVSPADTDWERDEWTASQPPPAPLGPADDDIEDADYLVVPPDASMLEPRPTVAPANEAPALSQDAGPDETLGAFDAAFAAGADPPRTSAPQTYPAASLAAPTLAEANEPEVAPVEPAPAPRPSRRVWVWLILALLLGLVALGLWVIRPDPPPRVVPVRPTPAAPSVVPVDTLGAVPADSAAAPLADTTAVAPTVVPPAATPTAQTPAAQTPAPAVPATSDARASGTRTAVATPPAATPGGRPLGRAPSAGQAILPPRVAGLPAADVRALSGGTVAAGEDAFTWVVLATPSRSEAEGLVERYRTSGYRSGVIQGGTSARPTYRVAVGAFASREQAIRLRDRLPPEAPPDTWALDLRSL